MSDLRFKQIPVGTLHHYETGSKQIFEKTAINKVKLVDLNGSGPVINMELGKETVYIGNASVVVTKWPYPKTIEEAAKLLDLAMPDWVDKIRLEINMACGDNCILGQNGSYYNHMKKLFGLTQTLCMHDGYINDRVFGCLSSNEQWQAEVDSRKPKREEKSMTFAEAIIQINKGKKIQRKAWTDGTKLINGTGNYNQQLCWG